MRNRREDRRARNGKSNAVSLCVEEIQTDEGDKTKKRTIERVSFNFKHIKRMESTDASRQHPDKYSCVDVIESLARSM